MVQHCNWLVRDWLFSRGHPHNEKGKREKEKEKEGECVRESTREKDKVLERNLPVAVIYCKILFSTNNSCKSIFVSLTINF